MRATSKAFKSIIINRHTERKNAVTICLLDFLLQSPEFHPVFVVLR